MTQIPVSVVVVSRNRPDTLIRCLMGLSQLRYAPYEVVVVADSIGIDLLRRWPMARHIKTIGFDEPNISIARNIGIEAAAGDVVAFIDDDAVPEPDWLARLARVFRDGHTGAAGGYVRGRNGISWQWTAQSVDSYGITRPLSISDDAVVVLTPSPGRAIKTEGTNMAFRRSVIAGIGGFDPNFHYFLDETDVNLRLAAQGVSTALVPQAVVHHGFAANQTRRGDRVPRDLTQLGASWAVFLERHCQVDERMSRWHSIVASERSRALRHMINGLLEPRDVRRLMAGLRKGHDDGLKRCITEFRPLSDPDRPFNPFPSNPHGQTLTLWGRLPSRPRLRAEAVEGARAGHIPTIYTFSLSAAYHRRMYHQDGFWEQRGGLFGRSKRSDPLVKFWRISTRVRRELALWSAGR